MKSDAVKKGLARAPTVAVQGDGYTDRNCSGR
jgi:hypothetical protein